MQIITDVFNAIMQACYAISHNWWIAIFLFTLLTKIILMPLSLWCQKNSLLMVKIMPELNRLKVKFFGDKETIGEKQTELNKKHHYHPLLSLLPLAAQIIILFGLVDVIHIITDAGTPETALLGKVAITDGGKVWIMPLLAALSSFILGVFQNHINPLQKEQSKAEQWFTNGISVALSAILGVSVAVGMIFYWICSNLLAILVQVACNVLMKPSKYIDYKDLRASQEELKALESMTKSTRKWYQKDPYAKREREDIAKFNDVVNKHLVFYSEGSGFYKYYRGAIEWLLKNSTARIHYITKDPNDVAFEINKENPRLIPYYMSEKKLITQMMKMDCDVFVSSLEDLDTYYLKRSYVRDDIEYVYFPHHMTSMHLVCSKTATDGYDTVMAAGPHQKKEEEAKDALYKRKPHNVVEYGYSLLDEEVANYKPKASNARTILIAPSWNEDNILDSCIDDLISSALKKDFKIIVRPHPEYVKRYGAKWKAIKERHASTPLDKLVFEDDFSTQDSLHEASILATDWSSISCEFSFAQKKPTIFIDTKMKEFNKDWRELEIEPTDITLRDEIGVSLDIDKVSTFGEVADKMMQDSSAWSKKIENVYDSFIYNHEHSAEVAGRYLLSKIEKKEVAHEA